MSFAASVLSRQMARVDQRYGKASRFRSSRIPGKVALGKPITEAFEGGDRRGVARTPAGERGVGEERIDMHRCLGNADVLPVRRDAGMEVGERFLVGEPDRFRKDGLQDVEKTARAIDEACHLLASVDLGTAVAAFVEPTFCARRLLRGWKPDQRQDIPRLEVSTRLPRIGLCAPHRPSRTRGPETRHPDRPGTGRVGLRQRWSSPIRGDGSALFRRRYTATSSAAVADSRSGPRNRAERCSERVLVRVHALVDQRRPGRVSRRGAAACRGISARVSMRRPAGARGSADVDATSTNCASRSPPTPRKGADRPDGEADEPEAKPQSDGRRACRRRWRWFAAHLRAASAQ